MEILLVTAILVAMASMAGYAYVQIQGNMTKRNTRTEIGTLESACDMYHSAVQSFPTTLRDLQSLPQGVDPSIWGGPYLKNNVDLMDPWNVEYKYAADEANGTVVITSAGPDKQFNTADDISNQTRQ
jgi:general secretion pathway protein G